MIKIILTLFLSISMSNFVFAEDKKHEEADKSKIGAIKENIKDKITDTHAKIKDKIKPLEGEDKLISDFVKFAGTVDIKVKQELKSFKEETKELREKAKASYRGLSKEAKAALKEERKKLKELSPEGKKKLVKQLPTDYAL